ncbi:MAG: DUF4397 domain-containing protein [Halovenus sp.]
MPELGQNTKILLVRTPGTVRPGDTIGTHHRRDVLRSIGVGLVAGSAGLATAQSDDESARVRVIHLSPDAPSVDVLVDGSEALTDVAFGDISDYLALDPGTYTVTITAAGDPGTVAFEGDVSLEGGTDYTVAAIGELSEGTFRPLGLVDDTRRPVRGITYLRVVHASPDAPAVDVTLFGGRLPLLKDVSFGDATDYLALPTGEYTVEIRPAGSDDLVTAVDVELAGESAYTAFANGYLTPDDEPGDEPFGLLPAIDGEDQPDPTGRLRVAHASPDAPNVDVFLGGTQVLTDVPFGAVSDYLEVPAGTATAKITPAGDPHTAVFEGDVTVEAGTDYTVAAIGELSEETFRPLVLVDDNSIERGRARVRVVHASPDAPAVDVTLDDAESTLVDGLAFGEASEYLSFQPGQPTVEVRPDSESNDNPFDAEFDIRLRPNRVYTAFAEGYFTADDEPTDETFTLVTATDAEGH